MVVDYVEELLIIIKNGFTNFIDFIKELPGLCYDLVDIIPKPFSSILIYFLSLFLFLITIQAIAKLWSIVKGG